MIEYSFTKRNGVKITNKLSWLWFIASGALAGMKLWSPVEWFNDLSWWLVLTPIFVGVFLFIALHIIGVHTNIIDKMLFLMIGKRR